MNIDESGNAYFLRIASLCPEHAVPLADIKAGSIIVLTLEDLINAGFKILDPGTLKFLDPNTFPMDYSVTIGALNDVLVNSTKQLMLKLTMMSEDKIYYKFLLLPGGTTLESKIFTWFTADKDNFEKSTGFKLMYKN